MSLSINEPVAVAWRDDVLLVRPAIDWAAAGLAAVQAERPERLPLIALGFNEYDRFLAVHPEPEALAALIRELHDLITTSYAVYTAPNRAARRKARRR